MTDFDLRTVLADRAYPTTSQKVWMNEAVWFEIDAIEKALATETDEDRVAELEAELAQLEDRKSDEAFRIHLRAVSNRAKEDMISAALHQFPVKYDLYGREDFETKRNREKLIEELSFAAHITKIVSPTGQEQILNEENRRDVTRSFLDNAPTFSIEIVDEAIGILGNKFAAQRAAQLSPDFS